MVLMADVEAAPPFKGLDPDREWHPYLHVGDGYKVLGYRRDDEIGYVLPNVDNSTLQEDGTWWATWAHPMLCGRPGWHHHALGSYPSKEAAAFAFDQVYHLERIAGNVDRCPNPPGDVEKGIPIKRTSLAEKGIEGIATIVKSERGPHPLDATQELSCGHTQRISGLGSVLGAGSPVICETCRKGDVLGDGE